MSKYKHIFFDLDRTLWDFETSANQTFEEMYHKYNLRENGIPDLEKFIASYKKHNEVLWALYRDGKIIKEVLRVRRWFLTLGEFNLRNGDIAAKLAEDYVTLSPLKVNLFPYTHEILSYLRPKYKLHLITNGFQEVQTVKLRSGDLRKYFDEVVTSEMAGYKKPDHRIFDFAINKVGCAFEEAIMIGDDLKVDIIGAKNVGMDQIFVNYNMEKHEEDITYEVNSLKEIQSIL